MDITLSSRISNTPPYAFAEVDRQVARLQQQGIDVIDFGVGDPKAPTPDFIIQALCDGAKRFAGSGYPSYIGAIEFRQACSDYLVRSFGVPLNPETEIMSTIGSKEAIFHFPLAFLDPGDIVICPTPGYPPYKVGTRFAGGVPYFVPLLPENDFLIDLEAIPDQIASAAKIIWINYPNSPTGKMAPREWLQKLVEWARRHNIIIAADEGCYIDIYFGDKRPVSLLEITTEGVIVFYSLSKRNNMTGYRAGFCAGDHRIVAAFKKIKTNVDSGCPSFIQHAAEVALGDQDHIRALRHEYLEKRNLLLNALQQAGLPRCENEATFYIWQRTVGNMSGEDLAGRLLEQGIVVTPGAWISDQAADGRNPGEHYVRFALVPTISEVEEAARRLLQLRLS